MRSPQKKETLPDYTCPKCGSKVVFAKPTDQRIAVYCAQCGAYIALTTYEKMMLIRNKILKSDYDSEKFSIIRTERRNGVITQRCGKCSCLLYNSSFPRVTGQFDLMNAKFCPQCGRALI